MNAKSELCLLDGAGQVYVTIEQIKRDGTRQSKDGMPLEVTLALAGRCLHYVESTKGFGDWWVLCMNGVVQFEHGSAFKVGDTMFVYDFADAPDGDLKADLIEGYHDARRGSFKKEV